MSTPTPTESKKVAVTPKIVASRVKVAEYARTIHRASPEASTKLDDVLAPAYWAHVAAKITLHDLIEVIPEGGAWYAQLLVVGCSKQHAKVVVLSSKKLREEGEVQGGESAPKFAVEFKGPQRKWSVIRAADKAYVKDGFDNKEDAAKWLTENEADLLA